MIQLVKIALQDPDSQCVYAKSQFSYRNDVYISS